MRLIGWIISLPLALAAVVFAVSNRQDIHFDLWPLPFGIELPAYLAVLGPLALGLLAGAGLGWLSAAPARRRARQQHRRAEQAERHADDLARQVDAAKTASTPS
ncbi:conserved hypothetical protein [Candidatus Terasakiella magnetica]|nr:conserved hypothetical protein [Candidatus Terasakiella magnetica]